MKRFANCDMLYGLFRVWYIENQSKFVTVGLKFLKNKSAQLLFLVVTKFYILVWQKDAPSLGGTAEDHPSNSVGAEDAHQPELAPLFDYEEHMELDLNEEHLEVNTEQDLINVPSDEQAMVV